MTTHYDNCETAAKKIIDHVGKTITMGVPLGIGKPIGLINAMYRLASADPSIKLTILTGLTLARPLLHNELEKRFIEPILERILEDYEDPLYERARELQQLPPNITVIEFFLTPGKYLHNDYVQQNYISSAYTNVVRDGLNLGTNVFVQQVAPSTTNTNEYSLSSNTDVFRDTARGLKELEREGKKIAIVAEVNANLPFMYGDAIVKADVFTDIIDTKSYKALFSLPRDELSPQDHLIGLYTSTLIKDGGCLQIGIGKLSNAVANALIMRQQQNNLYRDLLKQLAVEEKYGDVIKPLGSFDTFTQGLYASTEMMSDEYLHLYKTGILKKRVYDHIGLQRLLNSQKINETVTPEMIAILIENKIILAQLTSSDVKFLQQFGIFKPDISYQEGNLILTSGEIISADLTSEKSKQEIIKKCLGKHLISGKIIHAGFFLGSIEFYQQLRNLPLEELQQIDMTAIARTNSLYWSYELAQLQRQHARFINSAMMVTLGGVVISDGLKNLRELSGVGGQFDFVSMAQALKNARSIINCHSTRSGKGGTKSNILWSYNNFTIPRYLTDIVITEYGIADCRSKTDATIIKSMLNVADSRFQEKLLKEAKKFGKLEKNYEIPKPFLQNYPKNIGLIIHELQAKGYCKPYPFGSDFTDEEKIIKQALLFLNKLSKFKLLVVIFASFFFFKSDTKFIPYLSRMKLEHPKNIQDFVYKKLLKFVLNKKI